MTFSQKYILNIMELCKEKGIKAGDFERAVGVSKGYLSRWKESGCKKRKPPNSMPLETAFLMAEFFGLTIDGVFLKVKGIKQEQLKQLKDEMQKLKEEFANPRKTSIENAEIDFPVHFNHVNNSSKSYIWVELRPQKRNLDSVHFQRILFIDLHVVLVPDTNAEVKHTDLWTIVDKLDTEITPCIKIKDRYITVQEINPYIFDNILHYEFTLDFTDYIEKENNHDFMEELQINWRDKYGFGNASNTD